MIKRPRSITFLSGLFILLGLVALPLSLLPPVNTADIQAMSEFKSQHPLQYSLRYLGPILVSACGLFLLRGFNWARWLLVVWVGLHVVLGFIHSPLSAMVHTSLFALITYFLFRPDASSYFLRRRGTSPSAS